MICLILGTSDGFKLLKNLTEFTNEIIISTATKYGAEKLEQKKYKFINTNPLNYLELENMLSKYKVQCLVDLSHPYATLISKNAMDVCQKLNIEYLRYEREGVIDKYKTNEKIHILKDFKELKEHLKNREGNILSTIGSNKIEEILSMNLRNRIIHRVLPTVEVLKKCNLLGVKLEDIIAIKGPISFDLNKEFYKEYDIKHLILKDSGHAGGTEEKIKSALEFGIDCYVLEREKIQYRNAYNTEDKIFKYIYQKYLNNKLKNNFLGEI